MTMPYQGPQAMGMSEMGPQAGANPPKPKHLMTMLATLMLNKRLQQRQTPPGPPMGANPATMGAPNVNRMQQLAQMQLNMGQGQGRGAGLPPGLMGRPLPPGLTRRSTLPPGLM